MILVDRAAEPANMSELVARVERVVGEPIEWSQTSVRIGASVGYTICNRPDERPEDLLNRADHAMYGVKRARTEAGAVPVAG